MLLSTCEFIANGCSGGRNFLMRVGEINVPACVMKTCDILKAKNALGTVSVFCYDAFVSYSAL